MKHEIVRWLYHTRLFHPLIAKPFDEIAKVSYGRIKPFLKKTDKILDIGSGSSTIAHLIKNDGYNIMTTDIVDFSLYPDLHPVVFAGDKLPFADQSFDVAMLITVLHHTKHPEKHLKEASRVAKRLIIVEDTYDTSFQRYATYVMDSMTNLEFFGHPHTNKSDEAWRKMFAKLQLRVLDTQHHDFWGCLQSDAYHLEK